MAFLGGACGLQRADRLSFGSLGLVGELLVLTLIFNFLMNHCVWYSCRGVPGEGTWSFGGPEGTKIGWGTRQCVFWQMFANCRVQTGSMILLLSLMVTRTGLLPDDDTDEGHSLRGLYHITTGAYQMGGQHCIDSLDCDIECNEEL